jgi:hypothetical protein
LLLTTAITSTLLIDPATTELLGSSLNFLLKADEPEQHQQSGKTFSLQTQYSTVHANLFRSV